MSIFLVILCLALIALSVTAGVFYGIVIWRTVQVTRRLPTVRDGLECEPPVSGGLWPRVCLIVPAHNEADVIAELVTSLLGQDYPSLRIVFALDRCTDDTERIVREIVGADERVEILLIAQCPEEWAGKTHAVWRAVQDSTGARDAELLLFADADTTFDPALVRASVAMLHERKLDLLSLVSRLSCERWFERIVQPAATFELIRQYPLDQVNRKVRPRAFANGQFMLFRRELYDKIGGHEVVKSHLLEDIALARLINKRKKEIPSRWGVLMPGDGKRNARAGMLRCRMYRDGEGFRRGWKRIYAEAASRRQASLNRWARRLRFMGGVLPLAPIVGLAAAFWMLRQNETGLAIWMLVVCGAAFVIAWSALAMIYYTQRVSLLWLPLDPVGAWSVAGLLSEAAKDLRTGRPTIWAGRAYARGGVR